MMILSVYAKCECLHVVHDGVRVHLTVFISRASTANSGVRVRTGMSMLTCGWNTSGLWLTNRQWTNERVSIFMFELEFLSLQCNNHDNNKNITGPDRCEYLIKTTRAVLTKSLDQTSVIVSSSTL